MIFHRHRLAAALAALFAGSAPAFAQTTVLDSVSVTAPRMTPLPAVTGTLGADGVASRLPYVSDSAQLFADVPGMSFYGSGGVSSLPAIHGLNDERVRVQIDGMDIVSACANHMNPPLSYIDPANVGRASVVAGITPVSAGGDSIGGTIALESKAPAFARAGEGTRLGASLSAFYRSNGHATGGSLSASAASENLSLSYTGAITQSDNYKSGSGDVVKSSQYESRNHALGFALRGTGNLVMVNLGHQSIPYQGFPNAWMDMVNNESTFGNLRYIGQFGWGTLEARAFYEHTRHAMNFLEDKLPGDMPMKTEGENMGYLVKADIALAGGDVLRIGNEFRRFLLDDWWPPVAGSMMMGPGTFKNIDNGRRDRLGVFAEWEARWSERWSTLAGVRYDRVVMDTGDVRPYATSGMMQATDIAAAAAFNARDHKRSDDNVDLTLLARFTPDATSTYEFGYARKTRSPNLYERFAWGRGGMAMAMNGWFGDGNGYVGDLDLKPEVAHTLSGTASWNAANKEDWQFGVTPYYTYVKDYIDADRCLAEMTMMGLAGCPLAGGVPQTASNTFVYLQFANHDARLYGIDLSGKAVLAEGALGKFTGRGVLGYVNGKNRDTGEHLYHIMPLNLRLALDHRWNNWSNSLEFQRVAAKDDVQATRNETRTASYGLVNLRTAYDWKMVRVDAGIENLFDKNYDLPLGGAYLGDRNDQSWGNRVAGMGRSAYVGVTVKF
ncbi:MAG: TonB-dependent receptor [Azonexus sp.]|nr:TonB-dependent receptor [Betaproteobacteria bacterium]MBK8919604.1 TonB-dependent receptor [Betaproteobacteria bacterium]MBP6034845.1 TonB-dependent receptor [Azonexus sp.]MBP6905551.1 TonB-dependent receptor [Azonexus sp.]